MLAAIHQDERGLTLIELLVAVLILGLFAGLAAPRLVSAWDNAKTSACKSNLKQIEAALELYYLSRTNILASFKTKTGLIWS